MVAENNVEWWPVNEVRAACTGAIRALCAGAGSPHIATGVVARRNIAALQRRLLTLAHAHATPPPTAFAAHYHTALALLRGKFKLTIAWPLQDIVKFAVNLLSIFTFLRYVKNF